MGSPFRTRYKRYRLAVKPGFANQQARRHGDANPSVFQDIDGEAGPSRGQGARHLQGAINPRQGTAPRAGRNQPASAWRPWEAVRDRARPETLWLAARGILPPESRPIPQYETARQTSLGLGLALPNKQKRLQGRGKRLSEQIV